VTSDIDMIADVAAFHDKFGLEYDGRPRLLPDDLRKFRSEFLLEEAREYELSVAAGDCALRLGLGQAAVAAQLAEQLDALVDIIYVALGNAYIQGLPVAEAWRRVHAANMAKIRATSETASLRGGTADVVKPLGWRAPDHLDLVLDNIHRDEP
jgi:predicted HAD superfamily Cof-like phosphohydrolase